MSSNLFKSNWVVVHDDARVVDSNALAKKKIQDALANYSRGPEGNENHEVEGFRAGLAAESIELLENVQEESGIASQTLEEKQELEEQIQRAKEELVLLEAQAEQKLQDIQAEIEAMKKSAYEEAGEQGYEEGHKQGMAEADKLKKEYIAKQKQLEAEYQQKTEELEPAFIDALTGIYEHIFKVDLSDYQGLIAGLLTSAMQKTEGIRNFMVHVSKEDYREIMMQKEKIIAESGCSGAAVEMIEDMTLSSGQCFIETENGIYDCGLDTELKELERKLKLLSYEN